MNLSFSALLLRAAAVFAEAMIGMNLFAEGCRLIGATYIYGSLQSSPIS